MYLFVVIDRAAIEPRLTAYLAGRPRAEQATWLRQHGVTAARADWSQERLHSEIARVLCRQSDLALGAQAQQMLMATAEADARAVGG